MSRPRYSKHVPLNLFQRFLLFSGSGIGAFIQPRRADLVATFGEMTMQPFFAKRLRQQMLSDPIGRQILREKPRITSKSLDLEKLRALPSNTFGKSYVAWLDRERVSPDTRLPVRFLDDPEDAYVVQRYRECHDFYHAIANLPVLMEGEVAVKAFEFANLAIPMTGLAAVSQTFKMNPASRERLMRTYLPWAVQNGFRAKCLLNVYWEKQLDRDADELRSEIGITLPPDLRDIRRRNFRTK